MTACGCTRRSQIARLFGKLGRRAGDSPSPHISGSPLQRNSDALVRPVDRQGEMSRSLLRLAHHRRQSFMNPAALLGRRQRVGRGREQRVRESHYPSFPLDNSGAHGRPKRAAYRTPKCRCHSALRGLLQRGRHQQHLARPRRQRTRAASDHLSHVLRYRQRVTGRARKFTFEQHARDLKREERITLCHFGDPHQQRPRQPRPQPSHDNVVERRRAQWPQPNSHHPIIGKRVHNRRSATAPLIIREAGGAKDPDCSVAEASQCEVQHLR